MRNLSATRIVLLIVCGIFAAWLWVWLFGQWAAYDTPFLKLGMRSGLASSIGGISMAIFAFLSAAFFTIPLWLSTQRDLPASAAVSAFAFTLTFVIPALLDGDGLAALFSFTTLWLFVLFFGLCVFLVSKLRNAQNQL
jgi:hypothetical protein